MMTRKISLYNYDKYASAFQNVYNNYNDVTPSIDQAYNLCYGTARYISVVYLISSRAHCETQGQ